MKTIKILQVRIGMNCKDEMKTPYLTQKILSRDRGDEDNFSFQSDSWKATLIWDILACQTREIDSNQSGELLLYQINFRKHT